MIVLEGAVVASQTLEVKVCLRAKNQLTLPESLAERLGVEPGDYLIFSMDAADPGAVRIRPVRKSYAGVAAGVFGSAAEVQEYLRGERATWDE
jgi:hypothetical protein